MLVQSSESRSTKGAKGSLDLEDNLIIVQLISYNFSQNKKNLLTVWKLPI
jgi:hypothetical protein